MYTGHSPCITLLLSVLLANTEGLAVVVCFWCKSNKIKEKHMAVMLIVEIGYMINL